MAKDSACYRGAIGVEFFFIVSGYFLAKSAMKASGTDLGEQTFSYTMKRVRKLYCPFILAWLATFILNLFTNSSYTWPNIGIHLLKCIPELLLMQNTGIQGEYLVGPFWYVSSLLLPGMAIFPLAAKFKKTYLYVAAPVIGFFLLGFLSHEYGGLAGTDAYVVFMYKCTIRAIAEINIGIFVYGCSVRLMKADLTRFAVILLSVLELIGYAVFFWYIYYPVTENYDTSILLLSASVLITTSVGGTLLNRIFSIGLISKVAGVLGKLSIYIYIFHFVFAKKFSVHCSSMPDIQKKGCSFRICSRSLQPRFCISLLPENAAAPRKSFLSAIPEKRPADHCFSFPEQLRTRR